MLQKIVRRVGLITGLNTQFKDRVSDVEKLQVELNTLYTNGSLNLLWFICGIGLRREKVCHTWVNVHKNKRTLLNKNQKLDRGNFVITI